MIKTFFINNFAEPSSIAIEARKIAVPRNGRDSASEIMNSFQTYAREFQSERIRET